MKKLIGTLLAAVPLLVIVAELSASTLPPSPNCSHVRGSVNHHPCRVPTPLPPPPPAGRRK